MSYCLKYLDSFGEVAWSDRIFSSEEEAKKYCRKYDFEPMLIYTLSEYYERTNPLRGNH